MEKNASFLIQCKENYLKGIFPSDTNSQDKHEYKTLVDIALEYFKNDKLNEFSNFLMEGQYLVQLWTAHLILEYGQPDNDLKEKCIKEIIEYSTSPLDKLVADQERKWLNENNIIEK